jgi:hypothetical protein
MALVTEVGGGTLGSFNVGLSASLGFLFPLSAQVDALLGVALGPLQVDLGIQLNAALALQATLVLEISDPLAALRLAIAAAAQLQAALTAALTLPPVQLSLSAELSAAAALAGALTARIGGLKLLIAAALQVKIPAIKLASDLALAASAGPAIILSFDGIADGTNLAQIGGQIQSKFSSGVSFGPDSIGPATPVSGVIIVTAGASVFASLGAILTVQ